MNLQFHLKNAAKGHCWYHQQASLEFSLNGLRVDTLGFDKESRSFVIIEYKKDRNFTVIDQGYAYLALLLNNKAEFILKYNENNKAFLRKDNIDWSQSRIRVKCQRLYHMVHLLKVY